MTVEERIRALPIWPTTPVISPIESGRTNQNFLVICGQRRYFARVGYDLLNHRISRAVEARCAQFAARYGVAPAVHYAENGILVTDFVEGRVLSVADAGSPAIMERLARQLATLHALPLPQDIPVFDPGDSARFYLEHLAPGKLEQVQYARLETIIEKTPKLEPIALIHADLIPENIIDDGQKLWLIDWEYAGRGHPAIDLAFIAMNFELSDRQLDTFVAFHGDLDPDMVRSLRPVVTAREALWCLIQIQTGDAPGGDLMEYSRMCLGRLGL